MHNEIELTITGLVYNQTIVGTYGLVMSEVHGNRRFSVMIGEPEAQSIAMKLNNKKSPRPLTHDLINNILKVFGSSLKKIVIYNMLSDVFYSELHIKKDNEELAKKVEELLEDNKKMAQRLEKMEKQKFSLLSFIKKIIKPA